MNYLVHGTAIAAALCLPLPTAAQDSFPSKPVTLVVPSSPGAANDIIGRFLAEGLTKLWGQPVVVENVAGGGGTIAMTQVSKAAPDGYTLLEGSMTFALQAALRELPIDLLATMAPVAKLGDASLVVVAGNRVPIGSFEDLVTRSKGESLFVGVTPPGSASNMFANLVQDVVGVDWEEVVYKGTAEALVDIAGSRIDVTIGSLPSTISSIQSGAAKPVAIMNAERSAALPDVPTLAEAGYPDATASIWYGVYAPAGMPPEVLSRINADIAAVMTSPEAVETLAKLGIVPDAMPVADFDAFVRGEVERWQALAVKFKLIQ